MSDVRYKRILLKMGGEALAGPGEFGIDPPVSYTHLTIRSRR